MAMHVQERRCLRQASGTPAPRPLAFLGGLLVFAALGCGGGNPASGDHAGQLNGKFQIAPATATVIVGQSLQFSASAPWGGGARWSVLPATGGSIDAGGMFTASATPGEYQIVAMWNHDVRYTATALAWVVPAPPPAILSTGLVQAFGLNLQTSADGSIRNAVIAGEPVPARRAASANGTVQVRHGFYPPPAR
ncbi:MAG TPA: hypothetical protein DHV93_12100 [Holophagaceae bacterium]|nr:hypothetical protein [Holophagaceae bacterium]